MRSRGLAAACAVSLLIAACAVQGNQAASSAPTQQSGSAPSLRAHPQAIEPAAGAVAPVTQPAVAGVSVTSNPGPLPKPASNDVIRKELAQSGLSANPNRAQLTSDGLAIPPVNAPPAVQEVIAAGNEIARLPYRYGGGHLTYEDTAYDCSGSISFVFAAAHLLSGTVVSGQLMNWGDPGLGKWITVFANAGHTFIYVAGLRFDTVALAQTGSRWSNTPAVENVSTFAVRHPPGL